MKVIKNLLLLIGIITLAASCASTSSDSDTKLNDSEQAFIESLDNYKLSVVSSPKNTEFGKPFETPYIIQVKTPKGAVVSDLSITVSYPDSKKNSEYIFKTEKLTTDEKGRVSFLPGNTSFTADTTLKFYVTPVSKKKVVQEAAIEKGVSVKFSVLSKLIAKGAVLAVLEFNEKNQPSNNFYPLISELQAYGAKKAGNAPFSDSSILDMKSDELYKKNYEIIGTDFGYLIGGTVKYEKPFEKNDGIFYVYITAEFYILDMENGKEVYRTTINKTASDAKYNTAVSKCKKAVSKQLIVEVGDKL